MKTNFWKVALAALAAATLFAGCSNLEAIMNPKVSLSADSSFNDKGEATLSVSLSAVALSEVTVNLAVEGTVPETRLTWNPVVKVAASTAKVDVPVKVDVTGLEPGTYTAKFSIKAVSGAEVGSPKEATVTLTVKKAGEEDKPEGTPEVSLTSYDNAFANGKATLTLALSAAAKADVKVTFAIGTEVEEGTIIPAEALTFDNPVTIAAGETSKVVEVALDEETLAPGSNWAIISIASAEGATVGAKSKVAYIEAVADLTPSLRSDWSVAYSGDTEIEGDICNVFDVKVNDGETFYLFTWSNTVLNDITIDQLLPIIEEMVSSAIAENDPYQILTGPDTYAYAARNVGQYTTYIFGCGASGHLTGDYALGQWEVEASEEVLEAYNQWLGEWTVTRKNLKDTWVIEEEVPGASFLVSGIDGGAGPLANVKYSVDYYAAYDALVISGGNTGVTYNSTYTIYLCAFTTEGLVLTSSPLAIIQRSGENEATVASAGKLDFSDGTSAEITGMTFFASPASGNSGYVFNGQVFYTFPESMQKVVANEDDEVYNSYLGYWNVKRNDSEWDDENEEFVDKGEVTDSWYFTSKIAGHSFYVTGFEGFDVDVVVDYNPETGAISIKEQTIAETEEYDIILCGLFYYPGDDTYKAGNYIYDSGATVVSGTIDGDTIELAANDAGSYGPFTGLQLFTAYEDGYGAPHDDGYVPPITLVRGEAPAEAPAFAPRKRGNNCLFWNTPGQFGTRRIARSASSKQSVTPFVVKEIAR